MDFPADYDYDLNELDGTMREEESYNSEDGAQGEDGALGEDVADAQQ